MSESTTEPTNVIYGLYCVCDNCKDRREWIRYVGLTKYTASERFQEHLKNSQYTDNKRLVYLPVYKWMRKHGAGNIRVKVLEEVPKEGDLGAREIHWIERLRTFGSAGGLNMSPGGYGRGSFSHSEETKQKLSKQKIGRPGRSRVGLTIEDVRKIKIRLWNGETQSEIADDLGLTRKTLKDISQGLTWVHVEWPIGPRRKPRTSELKKRQMASRKRDRLGRMC